MSLQKETAKTVYIADGYANTLVIPFAFFDNQIAIYKNNEEKPLTEGIDYTIIGNPKTAKASAVLTKTPTPQTIFTIIRNVPLNQLVTFIEGEKFPATDYENSLDKITMALQMLQENINRCIKLTHNSNVTETQFRDFILEINKNFELIKKIPLLAQNVYTIYEELINFTTDTVDPSNNCMITSSGIAQYLQKMYYTKEETNNILPIKYGPITLSSENIVTDTTYTSYPYHIDIEIPLATSTHSPTIVLSLEDAISGIYAPISESHDGYVRIFLKNIPSSNTIEIPIILLQ